MAMTDDLYREFEAGVTLLEEELKVSLITRSELKGMKKGLEQGREQGQEQGREQGREQGLLQGRRKAIVDVAEARFGSLPEGLEAALQDVSDEDALARLTRLAACVASAEDLLEAVREGLGG